MPFRGEAAVDDPAQARHGYAGLNRISMPEQLLAPLVLPSAGVTVQELHGARIVTSLGEDFNAIVLIHQEGLGSANQLLSSPEGMVMPIADISGAGLPEADFHAASPTESAFEEAVIALQPIHRRLAELPVQVRTNPTSALALLARMYSRAVDLVPRYDPDTKATIRYDLAGMIPAPDDIATDLAAQGYLTARFFDRLHTCPACRSARLHVREECTKCRSPQLAEDPIVHHFKCGYQAPTDRFRDGKALVCPKCERELMHFGLDYDKPGSVLTCRACQHQSDVPAVGFHCLDCGTHQDGETMPTRDVYSYSLTAAGRQALFASALPDIAGAFRDTPQSSAPGVTMEFRHGLAYARRLHERYGRPFTLVRVRATAAEDIRSEHGERTWILGRALILRMLQEDLRAPDIVTEFGEEFLVLLPETEPATVDGFLQPLLGRITSSMRVNPQLAVSIIDPANVDAVLAGIA